MVLELFPTPLEMGCRYLKLSCVQDDDAAAVAKLIVTRSRLQCQGGEKWQEYKHDLVAIHLS